MSKTQPSRSQQQVVRRSQRLHTAISLLESACLTLERSENDGVRDLQQRVSRWCKQIRAAQQELVKELDECEAEIVTPNDESSGGSKTR